jgi:hypothetical protein
MKSREILEEESKAYLKEIDGQLNKVKDNAEKVVKIALLAGVGTLGVYWVLNAIFGDKSEDEDTLEVKRVKKKKLKKPKSRGTGSSLLSNELKSQMAMVALKLAADQLRKFLEDTSVKNEEG